MRKKYDLILPFGRACSCSQVLRAANLQLLSFPYDWTAPVEEDDLVRRTDIILNDFKDWFNKEDFVRGEQVSAKGAIMYRNVRTRHSFPHDFMAADDFESTFPIIAEKYRRRIERMNSCIRSSRSVLIFHLDTPIQPDPTPLADCQYALDKFSARHPGIRFDLCLLRLQKGRPAADLVEEHPDEHLTVLTFDYKDYSPGAMPYSVDLSTVAKILQARFSVRDYRSPDERKERKRQLQRSKFAANGASNAFQYRILKLKRLVSVLWKTFRFASRTQG